MSDELLKQFLGAAKEAGITSLNLTNEADRLADDFETWWQAEGQFSRAGGGDYEKTFAFNAWRAALAKQQAPEATAEPAAVPVGWRVQRNTNGSIGLFAPPPRDGESQRTSECFTGRIGNDMNEIVFKLLSHMLAAQGTQKAEPISDERIDAVWLRFFDRCTPKDRRCARAILAEAGIKEKP